MIEKALKAKESGLTYLNLRRMDLTCLPPELWENYKIWFGLGWEEIQ